MMYVQLCGYNDSWKYCELCVYHFIVSWYCGNLNMCICFQQTYAHFGSVTVPAKKFHIIMTAVKHFSGSAVNVYAEVKFVKDTVRVAQCRLYIFLVVLRVQEGFLMAVFWCDLCTTLST